jgi:hypothetical protein
LPQYGSNRSGKKEELRKNFLLTNAEAGQEFARDDLIRFDSSLSFVVSKNCFELMNPNQFEYLRFAPMTRVLLEEEHELAVLFPNGTVGEWNKSFSEVVPNPLMAGDDDAAPADDEDGFGDDEFEDEDDDLEELDDDDEDLEDEFDEFDDDEFEDDDDEFDDDEDEDEDEDEDDEDDDY